MTASLRFDGQVAIVTGAGGGLGRAYAHLLASRGAHVVVNNRSGRSDPGMVADEIGAAGGVAVADRHDAETEAGGIVQTAMDSFGRVDIIIANAGIATNGFIAEASLDIWRECTENALIGTVDLMKQAWIELAQRRGRIVTTSSSSVFGRRRIGPYAVSKAAILTLTKVAAAEGKDVGIRANAVLPIAYSKMNDAIPDNNFIDLLKTHFPADRVAPMVAWLAHDSVSVTGEAFTVGGGRVARVFLGVNEGWGQGEHLPEDYAAHIDTILASDHIRIPASSSQEVLWADEKMGIDLESSYLKS